MWLSSIVLGPKHAKNIDIYLRPLVGELNNLWKSIKYIYDAYTQSTFTLRELLLWNFHVQFSSNFCEYFTSKLLTWF
jgi:hypothetical protein